MKILDHKQGSAEWKAARLGLPTASNFKKVVTPTGKLSASSNGYLCQLVAEWFLGEPLDEVETQFMERGKELEASGANWYGLMRDVDPVEVGLCLTDDGRAGASPDRLIGDDGLLEIKCPSAAVHTGYLLGGLTNEYRVQVQGQLWVTGRQWCDLLSYHPTMPKAVHRFERDDEFIAALGKAMAAFCERLYACKMKLADEKAAYDEQREAALQAEMEAMEIPAGIA